jgi:type IV secretion system protein VirB9
MTNFRKVAVLSALFSSFIGASAALVPMVAQASATPYEMPQETRLVQFRYDPNRTYTVLTRPDAPTDIALAPGEKLEAFAIGDNVQWVTANAEGHIFIKPVRSGLFTAGTIVTNERSYQLSFRSSPRDGAWYQRVSWAYSTQSMLTTISKPSQPATTPFALSKADVQQSQVAAAIDYKNLYTNYKVSGESGVVDQVFDDGKSTWIKIDPSVRDLPAVFKKGLQDDMALVNYNVHDGYIQMQGVADHIILKLADKKVTIDRK